MNYEQFVQEMINCTKQKLSFGEQVEKHNVLKNNGVVLTGLSIRKVNESIAPILYLEGYYERYCAGESIEELCSHLYAQREHAPTPPDWDYRAILDYDEIQNFIVYRLINRERNEKLLNEIPYLPVFDLAIVFYVLVPSNGEDECSILIRNSHINVWKIPISLLYETARRNTPILYPYVFRPLSEYMNLGGRSEFTESPLWILTNLSGNNGASAILYPRMPKRLYEKLECTYYVLPSSIHEFLIVPEKTEIHPENLRHIVCEVNETQIEKEEVLGDSVYYFDGKNITKM